MSSSHVAGVSGGPRSGGSKGGDEGSGPAADGSHGSEAGGLSGGRAIFYRSNDRQEFMRERKDARDMKIYRSILALLGIPGPHLLTTRGETRLFYAILLFSSLFHALLGPYGRAPRHAGLGTKTSSGSAAKTSRRSSKTMHPERSACCKRWRRSRRRTPRSPSKACPPPSSGRFTGLQEANTC